MAEELRHIEHINNTDANLQTNLDNLQIGIQTDGSEFMVYKDDDGTYHTIANQNEAAAFLDLGFNNDLYVVGDTDTKIYQGAADEMVLAAGGVDFIKLDEDTQDVLTLNPNSADIDITIKCALGTCMTIAGDKSLVTIEYLSDTTIQGSAGFNAGAETATLYMGNNYSYIRSTYESSGINDLLFYVADTATASVSIYQGANPRIIINGGADTNGQIDIDGVYLNHVVAFKSKTAAAGGVLTTTVENQFWFQTYNGETTGEICAAKILMGKEEDFYAAEGADHSAFMAFHTMSNGTLAEKMRLASGGALLIGGTNSMYALTNEDEKLVITNAAFWNAIVMNCYSDTAAHANNIFFLRSYNDTEGTLTATPTNTVLGTFEWKGCDSGNVSDHGAYIEVKQNGAAAGKVPTDIHFYTSTNAATALALTIGTDKAITIPGAFNHDGTTFGALGAAPAAQQAHIANPSGGAVQDAESRTAITAITALLETFGFTATS